MASPTPEQKCAQLDLGISLSLALWPALTLAVQNNWGGPSSSDKRDWFGGAISEYVTSSTEVNEEDVEAMLVQVMLDEFEVAVDDGSAGDVADDIIRVRGECKGGEGEESESEGEEEDDDVEMGEPVAPRERAAPQIDEDGFETVVSRKKR
ncbi:hypothetical protein VC83_07562 [Pseudogymnoascus destructans]|uniref:Pre-rRNA-processing protein TSR2 n=1 Tax=Pseudogymnoascus destructans TaxID=655981 RepID=A0A177A0K1_9PEZI|nr:uncharacterized protein VC83_07562 [Pseudogymnoascus destructans]OAF55627.1 hypothetical protein VC83_07562 [Pseudogymnoascus destructans]